MYLVKYSSTLPSSTKYSQVQVLDQTVKYQVQSSTRKIVLDTRYSSTSTVLEPNPDIYRNLQHCPINLWELSIRNYIYKSM